MFIPGAMDGAGAGDAVAAAGGGVLVFTGRGVAVGIPGIGAIVGCAAAAGDAAVTMENRATAQRVRIEDDLCKTAGILRARRSSSHPATSMSSYPRKR